MRLMKATDEYGGGVATYYMTSGKLLQICMDLLEMLREDSEKMAAGDLHELLRCWENYHRMFQALAHVHTVLFREETRWPGYYFRSDFPKINEDDWHCFVNCKYDAATAKWEVMKWNL